VALGKGTEDGAHRNGFAMSRRWLGPERRCLTVAEALQRLRGHPTVGGGGKGEGQSTN
jgi:hypothetical protein